MINLTVVIDNDEALKKLKELQKVAKQSTSSVVSDAERMDSAFNRVKGSIAELAGAAALGGFVNKVIQVRGEVQQLEVAFETMLGSKAKAEALMADVINLAAKTPFGLQDVSNATKMLLAYGSTAESVADEIKMLGNIASGLSIPLNDMIYLYGTTRTQGRMFTQDLRQFMGRGIPLAEELAKQFGVTKDEVGALVTAGKVGFTEMQKALQSMTSDGGKFFNLMEKQSQTITGQISNLEDSIYQMFDEIGAKREGIISGSIEVVASLVENYERVGRILASLVVTYGVYRTALMLTAATAKGYTIAELARYSALVAVEKAQKLLNATMLKNPYVLVAAAVAGLVTLLIAQKNETERLKEAQEAYNEEKDKVIAKEEEHKRWIEKLTSIAEDEAQATDERRRALTALEIKYPEIFEKYETEYEKLKNIKQIKQDIAELEQSKSITEAKNELADVERQINDLITLSKQQEIFTDRYGTYTTIDRGLNADEEAKLKALQKRKEEINKEIRNNEILTIIDSADKLTDAELKSITERIKREQNKRSGELPLYMLTNPLEHLTGYADWSDDQLQAYLQKVERVSNERGLPKMTPAEDVERLKKEYEDAQKALDDFEKSKDKLSAAEIEKERKKLTEERDTKKKAYETATGSTVKQGETAAEKQRKEEEKKRKELNKALLELDEEYAQAVVDQMEEGEEKKLAQIEVNYQKEKNAINKEVEELKKLQGGSLTSEQVAKFDKRYSALKAERERNIADVAAADRKAMNEYLAEYGKYQEKRLAITELYAEKIAEATNEWERKTLEKERDAELKALDETMAEKSDLWVRLFGNAEKMSRRQLKSVLADTKQLLDYLRGASDIKPIGFTEEQLNALKGDAEKIAAIYAEIYEKQEEMERRNEYPFSNIINAFKKLKEAREAEALAEKEQNAESRQSKLESAESLRQEAGELGKIAASKAANTVTEIADAFMRLAEATDNANLKETAEQLGAFAQNLSAAGQGAASGGWIGAIVGGVSDMLMQTIDAIIGKQAEVHEFEQNRLDFMRQYQLMLLELNDSDYDSVFGTASLRKASDAWEKMAEAERLYKEATEGALGQFGGKMKEIANAGIGAFLFAPSLLDSRTTEEFKAYMDALQKGYNALEGMRVKTVDRSGWANFWGAKDEYTNLKDLAPELWGEDGLFNVDAARAFLETNTQLTEEQRKQIQNAIDLKDKYDEALSEIDQQIEDVFGGLASDLSDIIFDSVRNGTDAWDEFGKKGAEIIDALGKQMLQELIMTTYLEQYTEDLRAAFASGDSSQIAGVVNNIFDNMGMMFEGMSAAAQAWDANAEEMGFDMNNISQTATTARGFQTMSQETGSELNGRFTDIQGQTHRISEAVEFIKSLNASQLQQTTSISETVALIRTDTIRIAENTSVLTQMAADISSIKSDISNGGY